MMNRYPLWKYLLLVAVITAGCLYALPNLFGQDPALQISSASGGAPTAAVRERISEQLSADGIEVQGRELTEDHLLLRLGSAEAQVRAADELALALGGEYTVALNLAPSTPAWLQDLGGRPMYLGLDLRGGVHFLMDVDVDAVLDQTMIGYRDEFRRQLREADIRYRDASVQGTTVRLAFADDAGRDAARSTLSPDYLDLGFNEGSSEAGQPLLIATLSEEKQREVRNAAVEQNMTTLRNRVNELGVAEPVIQRQGLNRIVVQLPGVQDTARAKEIIGATATLEFRMVDAANFPYRGDADDPVPPGTERFPERGGGLVLLEREVIITG